jgi:DNA-binding response OmpR family regulator
MKSRRVLVADDDEDAALSLGDLLTLMGSDVRVALDVRSAIPMAAQQEPDLVLIEIGMERGAGLEACRKLRASLSPASSAIVALSAWTRLRDRLDAYEAGCSAYLFKPVEAHVLEALLAGEDALRVYEALAAGEVLAAYGARASSAARRGRERIVPSRQPPTPRRILAG